MMPMSNSRVGWDPFAELGLLQTAMNRLFESNTGRCSAFPPVNIWGNDNETVVEAEAPGMNPDSINLTVTGNVLQIEGERKPDELGENDTYHRQERGYGRFSRSIRLPYEVEASQIKAAYTRGLLSVVLPRKESSKPRRIPVGS